MKKTKPLLYDPVIINRVKQYLEDNVDKTYIDVGVMTKSLQERYPDYKRLKYAPFRLLAEQAYRVVSQSYGMENIASSADDSGGSDLEVMDETSSNNVMNNLMTSLYSKTKINESVSGPGTKQSCAAAPIDISSDESGDDEKPNGKVPAKGENAVNSKELKADAASKIPSSGPTADSSINAIVPNRQKKRRESVSTQPMKKQKIDNGNNTAFRFQQQNLQGGISSFNQSSHEPNNFLNTLQNGRQRKYKKEVQIRKSREMFHDVGGMEKILKELCELLMHIKAPDIYFVLGLMPPRGILLHGPPGCGKTLLAHAIAGQLSLPLIEIPATELIAGISGESEERIRDIFEQAALYAPCVLFIDEIDAISSNRSHAQKDMERRIVSQLISSMDNLKLTEDGQSVLVIGATTRPDVLDPALRRVGRFDHEVAIGIPTRKDRKEILTIICDGLAVESKCDFDKVAELTPGYVGADLLALVSRAAAIAVKRKYSEQMRAFHMKAQRNITIVELDDDDGEDANKSNNVADSNETATTTNQNKDAIQNGNNTETNCEKNISVEEQIDKSDKTDEQSNSAPTANETATDEPVSVADEEKATEEPKVDENLVKPPENDSVPSLFELLNWLENPPEDITLASDFCITLNDFFEAVKVIQPSAKREGFTTVPDVTWDDVGSLKDIREELQLAVLSPVKFPEKLERLGLTAPSGVLLCGPPGCGKTLLAKAIANEAGINFISVKGPELMNMYVGESERAVRACFQRARNSAPCVIFFDEFDSLCPKRSDSNESSSGTRVVNQLLTEMDGVEERKGVYILAATNRPDIIDPAILRPGRLDTILYVGLPQEQDRLEILKATTKNGKRPVLSNDVDFVDLAKKTDGYTGADLAGLVKQAAMLALKESNKTDVHTEDLCVRPKHFEQALKLLRPSVNAQDRKLYEKLRTKYAAPRIPDVDENLE